MTPKRKAFTIVSIVVFFTVSGFYLGRQYTVPVVMYHNIDDNSKASRLSVSPQNFQRQMEYLRKNNYRVVPLPQLADLIREKKTLFKTIAITFDDGYENNFANAYPVLKKYNLPATIFINVDYIGTPGYLSWGQIRRMSDSGIIDIGSHTLRHTFLPQVKEAWLLRKEIFESKRIIESKINKPVKSFSYPGGGFNADIIKLVKDAGYSVACATNPGKKYPKNDVFALKRLRIANTADNLFVFWIEISGFYTFIKEHRDKD